MPQNTEQWPTKSPVLSGVKRTSAVSCAPTFTSTFSSRKRMPWEASTLLRTRTTGWPFLSVISPGSNENFLAVTSIRRGESSPRSSRSASKHDQSRNKHSQQQGLLFHFISLGDRVACGANCRDETISTAAVREIQSTSFTQPTLTAYGGWVVMSQSANCHDSVGGYKSVSQWLRLAAQGASIAALRCQTSVLPKMGVPI